MRIIRQAVVERIIQVGWGNAVVIPRLVDLRRFTVELGISEVVGRPAKVDQGEVQLVGLLMDTRAAPEDLFEFGHRSHAAVEHYQAAGLHVDAGGEQARRSDQHGVTGFRVDEVAQLGLARAVAAGNAHDVAVVAGHQVGVVVDERLTHTPSVLLVDAEDDRLGETVSAFLQVVRDRPRHQLGPLVQHQHAVEVGGVVDAVLDLVALTIELSVLRTIPLHVPVDVDLDDLVGSQEAILDALLQGVGVYRLAEVVDVGDVVRFLGCGGEADLGGGREVLQDLAPC